MHLALFAFSDLVFLIGFSFFIFGQTLWVEVEFAHELRWKVWLTLGFESVLSFSKLILEVFSYLLSLKELRFYLGNFLTLHEPSLALFSRFLYFQFMFVPFLQKDLQFYFRAFLFHHTLQPFTGLKKHLASFNSSFLLPKGSSFS